MDLIKDESDVGQVVKVTYEDGVEFLNYNDVSKRVDESVLTLKMIRGLAYSLDWIQILLMGYRWSSLNAISLILLQSF